jgi:acetolactate synthase I/II/III large subunit
MTAAGFVARWLVARGMREVFELSGGMIGHLLDAFAREGQLRVLEVHHEQAAAFAACGLAQMRGRPSVAVASAGPGALNLISGIAAAHYDSVPLLAIVGQVQSYLRRGDRPVRQWALQETDFRRVVAPVAKAVFTAETALDVPRLLDEAHLAATSGRPGPAVVEIPFDVQGRALPAAPADARLDPGEPPLAPDEGERHAGDGWWQTFTTAQRPVILAGGGVRAAGAASLFRRWVERMGLPVVATLRGLDLLPSGHPLRAGLIGIYGVRSANQVLAESDGLLVLGSRLDHGVTAGNEFWLARGRKIVQVDVDGGELGARLHEAVTVRMDLKRFLERALERSAPSPGSGWTRRVAELAARYPEDEERPPVDDAIDPNRFLRRLSEASPRAAAFVLDAGQHTWWAAQSLRLAEGVRLLASPGLLAMGYALPAAIGVAYGERRPVVAVVGDGGLQLQIQELQTIVRARLPLKIVVLNNRCHGLVRQFQEEHFQGRFPATVWGYDVPAFAQVAAAYGIEARAIGSPSETDGALDALWGDAEQPWLLDVSIPTATSVWPFVPFGAGVGQMRPARTEK